MGEKVTVAVLECLNGGIIPQSLNYTYVALIPKVNKPTLVSEYRPRRLCNVVYKLCSKVISNRLKACASLYYFS